MGREHSWNKKNVVESYQRLDLARIKFKGSYNDMLISWPNNGSSIGLIFDTSRMTARFRYTQTNRRDDTKEDLDYTIPLDSTPCHFGGERYWFKCQGIRQNGYVCNQRVRTLICGGKYFVCRHCLDLSYKSRQTYSYGTPEMKAVGAYFKALEYMDMSAPKKKQYHGKPTKRYVRYCNRIEKAWNKAMLFESLTGAKIS